MSNNNSMQIQFGEFTEEEMNKIMEDADVQIRNEQNDVGAAVHGVEAGDAGNKNTGAENENSGGAGVAAGGDGAGGAPVHLNDVDAAGGHHPIVLTNEGKQQQNNRRGTRAGRNLRRFNPYEQNIRNLGIMLASMVHSSVNETKKSLQRPFKKNNN